MITIRFPDGSSIEEETYRRIEDEIWHTQWCRYATRAAFRKDMRLRARVWSGTLPRRTVTSKQFIHSLARNQMFTITEERDS